MNVLPELVTQAGEGEGVRATVDALASNHDQIILSLVALVATSIAALVWTIRNGRYVKVAADQATQANDAVNHKEHGETRIFEQVREIRAKQEEFDKRWGNLPSSIDNAVGLNGVLHDMNQSISEMQAELRQHVAWEMAQKYPKGEP